MFHVYSPRQENRHSSNFFVFLCKNLQKDLGLIQFYYITLYHAISRYIRLYQAHENFQHGKKKTHIEGILKKMFMDVGLYMLWFIDVSL